MGKGNYPPPSAKSLANLRPAKKGEVRNPMGHRDPPELREIRRLTSIEVAEVGSLVLKNDLNALKAIAREVGASTLKMMIAAVAVRVIEKGDAAALDILLNRLVGKVKDKIELSSDGPIAAQQVVVVLPSNGREQN